MYYTLYCLKLVNESVKRFKVYLYNYQYVSFQSMYVKKWEVLHKEYMFLTNVLHAV